MLCYRMDQLLLDISPPATTAINDRCCIRDCEDMRTVFVWGNALFRYDITDEVTQRYAAVTLVTEGWAQQQEVAAAFGVGVSTVRLWQRKHDKRGLSGLMRKKRRSPSPSSRGRKARGKTPTGTTTARLSCLRPTLHRASCSPRPPWTAIPRTAAWTG